MATIERILVPVHFRADVSGRFVIAPDSLAAVEQAADFAELFSARLTFAHAFAGRESPEASSDDGELPVVQRTLQGLVDQQGERGIEARWMFLFGMPWREVTSVAIAESYDLVVVGTRQRPGQGRLMGSTAAAVLTACPVPVLVAKPGGHTTRTLVVATDLSPADDAVVEYASMLAVRTENELHVVHACDTEGRVDELRIRRARLECETARVITTAAPVYENHVEEGAPSHVIWMIAKRVGAGMVVVGQHVHTLWEKAERNPTSECFTELPCSLLRVRS